MPLDSTTSLDPPLRVAGLFAGIGGIEAGLHRAGHATDLLCELEPTAQAVLGRWFPDVPLRADVREIDELPPVDLVAAGFPCQDLSQAGRTAGIAGRNSGLVSEVFRLIADAHAPRWLLLENVPFMLQLERGRAMRYLTTTLAREGYSWAYRIVDTRSFGVPQRRRRVILLASRESDPKNVLFHGNEAEPTWPDWRSVACGFYWTEGVRGLGWAVDAVPTLKGGSTIGIPSPPAIRLTSGEIVLPGIDDAERLQGFAAGWTEPALEVSTRMGSRWKLVGNAVSVPLAEWVGRRLRMPLPYDGSQDELLNEGKPWPTAAWGDASGSFRAELSEWPVTKPYRSLEQFLEHETRPLSPRATSGFLARTERSSLRFEPGFLEDVRQHLARVTTELAGAA